MPSRTLSEGEFSAIKAKLLAEAPAGMDEAGFTRWFQPRFDGALAEAEQRPAPVEGSALGRFASNAAAALNPVAAVKGIASAVAHPLDTGTAIFNAQMGQGRQALEGFQSAQSPGDYATAAGHGAAALLPMLGPAAAHAGEQIASGDVAGGLGAGAGLVAGVAAAGPATRAAGRVAKPLAQRAGRAMYQSALKPTKAVLNGIRSVDGPDGARRLLVDTGLAEGIPVTARGAAKAERLIDSLNTEVTRRIQAAERAGATVDGKAVEHAIRQVADDFSQQVNAQPELSAIDTVANNFARNPEVAAPVAPATPANFAQGRIAGAPAQTQAGPIPIATAQRMKQNTYKGLRGKYGRELGGTIEAEKAGARALKEGISQAVPDVAALNAREGSLIPLEQALADAMRRRGNYGIFGLTPVVASIPAVAHGQVLPLLASLVDRAPGLVSRGGIWINRAGQTGRVGRRVGQGVTAGASVPRTDQPPLSIPAYQR